MKTPDRPRLELPRTPAEWMVEAFGGLGLVLILAATAWLWPQLPERIPMHFDFAGNVDRYGSRGEWFLLPAVALAVYAGLTFLARVPHRFNFPVRITPENAARQYRLGRLLVTGLKAAVVWLFLATMVEVGRVALEPGTSPSPFVIVVPLFLMFAGIAAYFVAALRAR